MSAIATLATLIVSVRTACESTLRPLVRDLQTPSRVASLIHGLLCTMQLWEGRWAEAVLSTGMFFGLDMAMTFAIEKRMSYEMIAHHVLGGSLCLYSTLTDSAMTDNVGRDLTRALILLEITNPLLHVLVTLRRERLDLRVPPWVCYATQACFLLQFFAIRIAHLGRVLLSLSWELDKANDVEIAMFWLSMSLWCLQGMWFVKLMRVALKGMH